MSNGDGGDDGESGSAISIAFQPIVDAVAGRAWGYEAMVRCPDGTFPDALPGLEPGNDKTLDRGLAERAIAMAARLFPAREDHRLSIKVAPNVDGEPELVARAFLDTAERARLSRDRIVFALAGRPGIESLDSAGRLLAECRRQGFLTAIDDFGAGHAGLTLLAKFQPDIVKLDTDLVRGIESSRARQVIVAGTVWIARTLGLTVLAEGVETEVEMLVLRAAGIRLFQGSYFARPAFEALPDVAPGTLPALTARTA